MCGITAAGALAFYLVWVLTLKIINWAYLGRPLIAPGADHLCHLAGAVLGTCVGLAFAQATETEFIEFRVSACFVLLSLRAISDI